MIINIKQPVYIVGVRRYWRPSWRQFFGYLNPKFVAKPEQVPAGASALIWGVKTKQREFKPDVRLYRVEDGFLRSVGLGANFTRPCSWVVDSRGMYFDSSHPSDLEYLLQNEKFTSNELQRADTLIEQLRQKGISKYNTGNHGWQPPDTDKKIILVPGQVETDASIQLGSPQLKTNIALLQQVRDLNPGAYIIYKPHPDVVAGARASGEREQDARLLCDCYITDININDIFTVTDEVHTLTSLSGFEALVRGKNVHCYGQPFYSGWGLTVDHQPLQRRSRRLTIQELVAATLIRYPLYRLPKSDLPEVSPEQIIECLYEQQKTNSTFLDRTKANINRLVVKSARILMHRRH